jgi:hypothetical protein
LAEDRGLPEDVSDGVRAAFIACLGPEYSHSTTWITGAELAAADWNETDSSGVLSRRGRRHPLGAGLGGDAHVGLAARPGERTARRLVRSSGSGSSVAPSEWRSASERTVRARSGRVTPRLVPRRPQRVRRSPCIHGLR